jgi:hypothetical protein
MALDTRRFWLKLTAAIAPVVLCVAIPVAVLWRTGEFETADQVAARILRGERELRYNQMCTDQWRRFKLVIASSMSPDVMILGGSSSLQVRGEYFLVPFYNAAGSIGSIWHATEFLRRLGPAHLPRLVVVGLHSYLFLESWKPDSHLFGGDFDVPVPTKAAIVRSCAQPVARRLLDGRVSLRQVVNFPAHRVGLPVLIGSLGFRADGSYDRGEILPIPQRFETQLANVRWGSGYFPFGGEIAAKRVAELREFLDYARAADIHVVAYFPPVASAVRDAMSQSGGRFDYAFHAFDRLSPVFAEYGFTLLDATDLRTIGATDEEMLDGTHPSETADLRLVLALTARDSSLAGFVDADRLWALLANAPPLSVLGD